MDIAQIKRAKRIRRQFLRIVESAKASGPIRGRMVADILESLPDAVENDAEILGFGHDLINAGLLASTDARSHKEQRPGLDYTFYSITAKGTGLLAELEPVCPLVEDERRA